MKAGLETVVRSLDLKSILGKGMLFCSNRVEILWTGLCTFSLLVTPVLGSKQGYFLRAPRKMDISVESRPYINHIQVASITQRSLFDLVVE